MPYRALTTAGWLAMISAFVSIPLTYVSYCLADGTDSTSIGIQVLIQVAGVLLYVTIAGFLKKLLNSRFTFHDTDKNIALMIIANIVAAVIAIVALCFPQTRETLDVPAFAVLVFQGIVQIQFGYKLLNLQNDLDRMLKPFCYLNMATGVCLASVVFLIVGVVVSSISDLMLGTIFFHVAQLAKEPDLTGMDT